MLNTRSLLLNNRRPLLNSRSILLITRSLFHLQVQEALMIARNAVLSDVSVDVRNARPLLNNNNRSFFLNTKVSFSGARGVDDCERRVAEWRQLRRS